VKGEAHFNVEHDANRPFEVLAGHRVVKAIGTAFSVYRSHDKIEVMVSEGKVELAIVELAMQEQEKASPFAPAGQTKVNTSANSPAHGKMKVIASLQAGQSVSLPSNAVTLSTPVKEHAVGELARKLSWLDGKLVFAGESLEEVVAEVSRHTSVVIEVADPNLRKLRIGGQFKAGETDALFDVLESGFGVKITRLSNNRVRLDAK
jgi:transmembrane sensor